MQKLQANIHKERKKKLSAEQIKEIQNRMNERKTNATALAKEFRISRGLLYQVLKA